MNDNIAEGRWKRMRGSAKEQWGNLTGNNLDRAEGKLEKLAGVLQEKYGYTREKADKKIERRLKKYDQKYVAQAERARRMNKRQSIGW
ncbi:MAG: CsbD family protein [Chloroflexi bacterium]|nr:CsbD family protein [Chloroflexota bacterium]